MGNTNLFIVGIIFLPFVLLAGVGLDLFLTNRMRKFLAGKGFQTRPEDRALQTVIEGSAMLKHPGLVIEGFIGDVDLDFSPFSIKENGSGLLAVCEVRKYLLGTGGRSTGGVTTIFLFGRRGRNLPEFRILPKALLRRYFESGASGESKPGGLAPVDLDAATGRTVPFRAYAASSEDFLKNVDVKTLLPELQRQNLVLEGRGEWLLFYQPESRIPPRRTEEVLVWLESLSKSSLISY